MEAFGAEGAGVVGREGGVFHVEDEVAEVGPGLGGDLRWGGEGLGGGGIWLGSERGWLLAVAAGEGEDE